MKKWGTGGIEERVEAAESDKFPSTLLFLWYTPALQHALQDLRWCKLFYSLFAVSEEINYLTQISCIFFFKLYLIFFYDIY